MKVKKFSIFDVIDMLFWLFIMIFPIVSYLVYLPNASKNIFVVNGQYQEIEKGEEEEDVPPVIEYVYRKMNYDLIAEQVDLSGAVVHFSSFFNPDTYQDLPYDDVFFMSSNGYSLFMCTGPYDVRFLNSSNEVVDVIYSHTENSLNFETYVLPLDFGFLTQKFSMSGLMVLIDGFDIPMSQANFDLRQSEGDLTESGQVLYENDVLSFAEFWQEKLAFMPLTDNVVGNALIKLFEKSYNFFGFFGNATVFVSILLWIIAVEFAHFFVDFVLFLPRYVHSLMDKFTDRG